jgi:hypothetical protein
VHISLDDSSEQLAEQHPSRRRPRLRMQPNAHNGGLPGFKFRVFVLWAASPFIDPTNCAGVSDCDLHCTDYVDRRRLQRFSMGHFCATGTVSPTCTWSRFSNNNNQNN